jgi:hypothetical protein
MVDCGERSRLTASSMAAGILFYLIINKRTGIAGKSGKLYKSHALLGLLQELYQVEQ